MMCGEWTLARILTSFKAFSFSFSLSAGSLTRFRAKYWKLASLSAL